MNNKRERGLNVDEERKNVGWQWMESTIQEGGKEDEEKREARCMWKTRKVNVGRWKWESALGEGKSGRRDGIAIKRKEK